MEGLSLTGLVATIRAIIIGVGHSEKSKNAAVLSIKPASTPSFSATATLTIDNGERRTR